MRKSWIGIILIIFGFGFLLEQAGIWDFSEVLAMWWPLILILIGVIQLSSRSFSGFSAFLFIAIGGLLLINQWADINMAAFIWPVILIIMGFTFIFSRARRRRTSHTEQSVRVFTLFSGSDVKNESKDFTGGQATSIFGGAEIDLRNTTLSEDGAYLEITALFGGVSVYVPEHIRVDITGIPIFGGWEDKTRRHPNKEEDRPVLHVHCLTIFGGAEFYH